MGDQPVVQHRQDRMDATMDMDTRSNSVVSMTSTEGPLDGRSGSVTLDDPDVRLAAEALGDLRAGMYTCAFISNAMSMHMFKTLVGRQLTTPKL